MSQKIQLRRGNKVDLPLLDIGEPGFCTDTGEFFVGSPNGNISISSSGGSGIGTSVLALGEQVQVNNPVTPDDPSNLQTSLMTKTSFTLNWNPSTTYHTETYNVYNGSTLIGSTNPYTRQFPLSGLSPNTAYNMKVTSVDEDGLESSGVLSTVQTNQWDISMNSVLSGDYLKTPSLTFDEFILDFSFSRLSSATWLVDGRLGLSNSHIVVNAQGATTDSIGSYWNQLYVNSVLQTQTSNTIPALPTETRMTIRGVHSGSGPGTNAFIIFGDYGGKTNTRGKIYGLKLLYQGALLAQYNIANGTVQDISGNNNHATLYGGVWE